ncbi:antitoxin VbhA family protein [Erythrobacter sp. MTPC3]|uniref:antitoxin VbhA family protein n=1 Tax=Erythrobacter sp. MTPC3 TaxID=3056564 RepID=UPI0036F3B6A4
MNAHSAFPAASPITAEERAARKAAVDFARGSIRFEGGILSAEIEALNTRFINGELDNAQHTAAVLELCNAQA